MIRNVVSSKPGVVEIVLHNLRLKVKLSYNIHVCQQFVIKLRIFSVVTIANYNFVLITLLVKLVCLIFWLKHLSRAGKGRSSNVNKPY